MSSPFQGEVARSDGGVGNTGAPACRLHSPATAGLCYRRKTTPLSPPYRKEGILKNEYLVTLSEGHAMGACRPSTELAQGDREGDKKTVMVSASFATGASGASSRTILRGPQSELR